MRPACFLAILYGVALADSAFAPLLRVGGVEPDFLALMACVVVFRGGAKGFLAAGVVGLASDLLGPGRIGIDMAVYLVVGFALSHAAPWRRIEHPLSHTLLAWLAVSMLALGIGTCRWLLGEVALSWTAVAGHSLLVGAYSAALGLPLFMLSNWWDTPARLRQTAGIR
jgi:rod shape-determining protein MreD